MIVSNLVFFEFNKRSLKILWMREDDRIAVRPDLGLASGEQSNAVRCRRVHSLLKIINIETNMMDSACRLALKESGYRGCAAKCLQQLNFYVFKFDERHPDAVFRQFLGRGNRDPQASVAI